MSSRNKITEAFRKLPVQEEEELELEAPSEEDEEGEFEPDHSNELTDEEVVAEAEEYDAGARQRLEQSRRAGRESTGRSREVRPSNQRAEAAVRNPKRERVDEWRPANSLDAPPPRGGMEQRWIRFMNSDRNDPRNWSRKCREGWRPRRLDTVAESFAPPTSTHSQLGEVIAVGDLILCERPKTVGVQRKKFFAAKHQRQVEAAGKKHVRKVQKAGHEIAVTERRDRPTVGTGTRRPSAQED